MAVDVEAASVIRDGELGVTIHLLESHLDATRAGMGDDIAKGLLCNAVERQRRLGGNGCDVALDGAARDGTVQALDVGTVSAECGGEAGMLQDGRMQVVGDMPDVLGDGAGALVQPAQVFPQILPGADRLHPVPHPAECDGDSGQLLADVVVQVTRDARALGVPGLDEPACQPLDLIAARLERCLTLAGQVLGLPALSDVDGRIPCTRCSCHPGP